MSVVGRGGVGVVVMPHARERARERFPGFKAARIVDEVRAAFDAGRVSARAPRGVRPDPACLYAWTESGERVYALGLHQWDPNAFVVVTTLRASAA